MIETGPPRLSVWPPLPPNVHLRPAAACLPFPLEEPTARTLRWARHGLWLGVRALGLEPGDEVLTPAYHHGSEVEALEAAGLVCRFYDTDGRLAPEEAALERLLGPRVRALHLTHFLGFPQDTPRWRRWCDERGLRLIEDAAQAWLGRIGDRPIGSWGDVAVFCLYKTFGLAEGAVAVISDHAAGLEAPPVSARGWRAGLPLLRRHGAWLGARSGVLAALSRSEPAPCAAEYDARARFALGDPGDRMTRLGARTLRRVFDPDAATRRRSNYRALLARLGSHVPTPFGDLPAGASPFAFPVVSDDKERLLSRLHRSRIDALDLWSVPHPSLPPTAFPEAERRRRTMIALPVHQELRDSDLDRIAEAVLENVGPKARPIGLAT